MRRPATSRCCRGVRTCALTSAATRRPSHCLPERHRSAFAICKTQYSSCANPLKNKGIAAASTSDFGADTPWLRKRSNRAASHQILIHSRSRWLSQRLSPPPPKVVSARVFLGPFFCRRGPCASGRRPAIARVGALSRSDGSKRSPRSGSEASPANAPRSPPSGRAASRREASPIAGRHSAPQPASTVRPDRR